MRQSPVVQTLAALSIRERQELGRWVQSPAFNRRPEVERLFHWIATNLNAGPDGGVWAKTEARRQLALDDPGLRYAMSFLFQVVKQYMAWREWSSEPESTGLHLCRALRKKGLAQVFVKEFKPFGEMPAGPLQHAGIYLQRYQIHFEHWEAQHRTGLTDATPLRAADAAFGNFVAITALRHGCAALDKPGLPAPEQLAWLPETLAAVGSGRFAGVPAVQVYYHCFKIMQNGEDLHFYQLKHLLAAHDGLLPQQELRDVYLVGINFCIKQLNAGARGYIREALDLYRVGLERHVIPDNGVLSKATYQNILLLALALEEWDWARDFLETCRSMLPSGERHNTYHFNLALYYFRKKAYREAQEILRRVEFRDVFHNLDARRMLVRIYYDTGAHAALDSLLHSFRIYLQRHRNIGYHRELNVNFVRYAQRLLRLEPGDSEARAGLQQRMAAERYLAEREWLMEQANPPETDKAGNGSRR